MRFEHSLWVTLLSASAGIATPHNPKPSDYSDSEDVGDFNSKCTAIASKLAIENANVHFSQFVAAGTNLSFSQDDPGCNLPFFVVPADICRVTLSVSTSERSELSMEAWLPSNWTGRFLSGGNGGLSGCIKYQDLAYASGLGFAAVGTNNGHNGTSGKPFLNNPDVVEDFAYRA